jgi:hypothetical protein
VLALVFERFVPGFLFLGFSWAFYSCSRRFVLVPGVVGRVAADSGLYWLRVASCGVKYFKSISGRGIGGVSMLGDILRI